MKYGVDFLLIDGEGCSCIYLVVQFGYILIVVYFIVKGQDVDMMDQNGMMFLMWVVYRIYSVDLIRLFLIFNVLVNFGDKYYKNIVLYWVVLVGNIIVISFFLEVGVNVDV